MQKREPSNIVGVNINWCSHYGEQDVGFLKKLKRDLPYDHTISLLNLYWKKQKPQDRCILMFIAALFIVVKTQKPVKYWSTEYWIKKIWYMYIFVVVVQSRSCAYSLWPHGGFHSGILLCQAEWNISICSNMDGPREYYTLLSQRWIEYDITYMCNLNK